MTSGGGPSDDDRVPVSVRLGEVVPPEDPEDWTRPLTWVAALGMLAAPALALGWFALAPPSQGEQALPATFGVAVALAAGAVATGSTQQGIGRAVAATLGGGLFAALGVVIVGVVMTGERQGAVASPMLAQAFGAAVGGLGGVLTAAVVGAVAARIWPRPAPIVFALAVGALTAMLVVDALLPEVVKA